MTNKAAITPCLTNSLLIESGAYRLGLDHAFSYVSANVSLSRQGQPRCGLLVANADNLGEDELLKRSEADSFVERTAIAALGVERHADLP